MSLAKSIAALFSGGSAPGASLPPVSKSTAYTLITSDTGKHVAITSGGITVPAGVFSPGDTVTIFNNSASPQTITQGASVTMYLAGSETTGSRTLAGRGLVTVLCVSANVFTITGSGLS